jgi:1,4-alpha-glucan branching enzyme
VVHGKGSLLGRMPGDDWQKFANLRALLGFQWLFPGKMLLFMGGEIGQRSEWNANVEVDWASLQKGPYHRGVQRFVQGLNALYHAEPALWQADFETEGFQWIDCLDNQNSVISFFRSDARGLNELAVILNLTPVPRQRYRIGLPRPGKWLEVLNSDAAIFGGSNMGNMGSVISEEIKNHNQPCSAEFVLPPLSIIAFRAEAALVKNVAAEVEPLIEAEGTEPSEGSTVESHIALDPAISRAGSAESAA